MNTSYPGLCFDDNDSSFEVPNHNAMKLVTCSLTNKDSRNQIFQYNPTTGLIRSVFKELCVKFKTENRTISLTYCYDQDPRQRWDYDVGNEFFRYRNSTHSQKRYQQCLHAQNDVVTKYQSHTVGYCYTTYDARLGRHHEPNLMVDRRVRHKLSKAKVPSRPYYILSHFASYCLDDAGFDIKNQTNSKSTLLILSYISLVPIDRFYACEGDKSESSETKLFLTDADTNKIQSFRYSDYCLAKGPALIGNTRFNITMTPCKNKNAMVFSTDPIKESYLQLKNKIDNKDYCVKYEGNDDLTISEKKAILAPCPDKTKRDRSFEYIFVQALSASANKTFTNGNVSEEVGNLKKRGVGIGDIRWASKVIGRGEPRFDFEIWYDGGKM